MKLQPTYKIVGSYKGDNYEDLDIVHGEEKKDLLLEEYRKTKGINWHVVAYRIDE